MTGGDPHTNVLTFEFYIGSLTYKYIITNLFNRNDESLRNHFRKDGDIEGIFTPKYKHDPIAAAECAGELKKLGEYLVEVATHRRSDEYKSSNNYRRTTSGASSSSTRSNSRNRSLAG